VEAAERPGFMKGEEIFDLLSHYWLLKKYPVPRTCKAKSVPLHATKALGCRGGIPPHSRPQH
jgi:hypothetical protein